MGEENSSFEAQMAERDLKRKQKEVENSRISKNKQLEGNPNANACKSNPSVLPGKFPSRSARRSYIKRRLKKEAKVQAGEPHNMQRNDGDTTTNETCHIVSNSTISSEMAPEMNVQNEVLPSGIYRLALSNHSVPQQEATRISEAETIPSSNEILTVNLQEIIESRSNRVMREGNSSLKTQLAVTQRDSKRKQKEIENSRSSKNEQLEEKCNATTREPNSDVPLKKFPSRSARRKYAQRQLKKEMKKRARGLQDMQTNGGDTTTNDTHHRVYSRHESLPHTHLDIMKPRAGVDAVELERFHQESNFARVECESHHPDPYLPSGSALRESTRRQLKKDLCGHQPLPPTYLDWLQRRRGGNAVWPERLHQASLPDRTECDFCHLGPSSLGNSSSCYESVKPINNYVGLIRKENVLSRNNWNMAPTSGTEELQWETTGNAAVNANVDNALGHTSIWFR